MLSRTQTSNANRRRQQRPSTLTLRQQIEARIREKASPAVWTANDFLDLGSRDAVDKALQRLTKTQQIRRIDRGLYDMPSLNRLTGRKTVPDYKAVIEAVARRDQARILIDGITAANELGLTDAVPAQVVVHTDARLKPIKLGNLVIRFKLTAPSRLYWAGRPAMRIVQALHWLHDMLPENRDSIVRRLAKILGGEDSKSIRDDLEKGLHALPSWMQDLVRDLLARDKQAIPPHRV